MAFGVTEPLIKRTERLFSDGFFAVSYLGFLVIMHPSQMFAQEVKTLYNGILAESSSSINLKIQILKNLQTYLQEEDTRMQEADRECKYFRCC